MTARHFRALAAALADQRPFVDPQGADAAYLARMAQWRRCVDAVADMCYATNGRFDRSRFEYAAGVR